MNTVGYLRKTFLSGIIRPMTGCRSIYARVMKRPFDLVSSSLLLFMLSPILIVAALATKFSSPGPVFFLQDRLGRNGRPFRTVKFRTMIDKQRTPTHEIYGNDPEVTRVGFFLRRSKVDELPQLWNVIRGEMSLIGPRPALLSDMHLYDETAVRRLLVRPGMTGLAQVHGNIHLSWPERWIYDARYVDNLSFLLDVRILLRTIVLIFVGEHKLLVHPGGSR